MNRWRKALIAASVGMAASAAFVATSAPGQAQASLIAKYLCTGGVAGTSGGVEVEAVVTPRLRDGMLDVEWSLRYLKQKRFGSPGFFVEGSTLDLEGVVDISGAWRGQLRPQGAETQAALVPGDQLVLPRGLSDAGSVQRPGKIRVKPGPLAVRFTPAQGEVMVNNDNSAIAYAGTWHRIHPGAHYDDHLYDLHRTDGLDARAKLEFTGTKVAYIGRREPGLGPIRVLLDDKTVTDPLVQPGNDRSGEPMTGTESKEVLWESPDLEYGSHTIEVVNVEAKTAYLDAFRVTTGEITESPKHNEAKCDLQGDPGAIELTVPGNSPSPTPTLTPTSPTPTYTPPPTPTHTGGTTPPAGPTNSYNPGPGENVGVVSVSPRPTRTTTVTATPKSTRTTYVKAQVAKTPKGGVDTGEAPETGGAGSYGLIAGGSMLLMGSATGGLLLRRRRATHAGGAQR
ncbi:LPXTG cell wall anchor domain-containing protein [Nonomuraea muscovyensis]